MILIIYCFHDICIYFVLCKFPLNGFCLLFNTLDTFQLAFLYRYVVKSIERLEYFQFTLRRDPEMCEWEGCRTRAERRVRDGPGEGMWFGILGMSWLSLPLATLPAFAAEDTHTAPWHRTRCSTIIRSRYAQQFERRTVCFFSVAIHRTCFQNQTGFVKFRLCGDKNNWTSVDNVIHDEMISVT